MRTFLTLFMMLSLFANAEKKSITFSDGGKCQYETVNGMLQGDYRSFHTNGRLKCEGTFQQNNRVGFWVFYKADGKIQCMRDYKSNYSYDEKTPDGLSKKVSQNENNSWTMIRAEDVLSRTRNIGNVMAEKNKELFTTQNISQGLVKATISSGKKIYSDSRFTNAISSDILNNKDITGFRIKEDRILDKTTKMLQYRIVGIAPLIAISGEKEVTELCWIYYGDIKDELAKIKLSNNANNLYCKSLGDIFEARNYSSEIEKSIYAEKSEGFSSESDLTANPLLTDIELENTLIINNFSIK